VTAKESERIRPGNEIVYADIDGHRFGLTICYDLRFPELFRSLALMGCEAIFLPAAFTLQTGRDHWEILIRARAIENSCYMLASGLVGKHESGGDTYGHSMIVDPWGTVVSNMPDEVGIVVSELDFARQARIRQEIPVLTNRQPEAYPDLLIKEAATVS
jgi:predicted amidohydrolase